jgi:hypothetical protein
MALLKKRNGQYYAQWYEGARQRRVSLRTDSVQIAKARLRKVEARLEQGDENPVPTRTAIGTVLGAYVRHVRTHKTGKSAQTDIAYLRQAFGACCPELANSSRRMDDPAATQAWASIASGIVPARSRSHPQAHRASRSMPRSCGADRDRSGRRRHALAQIR